MLLYLRVLTVVFVFSIALLLAGCNQKAAGLRLDTRFSSNLVYLTKEWPGNLELTDAQTRLLEEKGEPSFERILWDPSGSVKSYMDVATALLNKSWRENDRTWIYLDSNKEYEFVSRTNFIEKPLTDLKLTLCKYGDPQQTKTMQQGKNEPPIIIWTYLSHGKNFHFLNEAQYRLEHFDPMPGFQPY